jgi:hypothetical protein
VDFRRFVRAIVAWSDIPVIIGLWNDEESHQHAFHGLEAVARGLVLKTMWSPESEGKIKNWNQVDKSFPDMPLALYGAGTAMDPSSSCAARRWNLGRKSPEHCFARTARAPDQADRPTRCASEA